MTLFLLQDGEVYIRGGDVYGQTSPSEPKDRELRALRDQVRALEADLADARRFAVTSELATILPRALPHNPQVCDMKCEHCQTEVKDDLIKFPSSTAHTAEKCRDTLEARLHKAVNVLRKIRALPMNGTIEESSLNGHLAVNMAYNVLDELDPASNEQA